MLIPEAGAVILQIDEIRRLLPILRPHVEAAADDDGCEVDTDPIEPPSGASKELVACMDAAYFDFLVALVSCGTDCECKREVRRDYETAVEACKQIHGA